MSMSRCRSCGAEITWAIMPTGKRAPFDAKPSDSGTHLLEHAAHPPDAAITARRLHPGEEALLYVSHFATCPQAAKWRKKDEAKG